MAVSARELMDLMASDIFLAIVSSVSFVQTLAASPFTLPIMIRFVLFSSLLTILFCALVVTVKFGAGAGGWVGSR